MVLHLRSAARSDVGLVRAENEDSGYAGARILVVADGMGGHAAGELASSAAVAKMAAIEQGNDLPCVGLRQLAHQPRAGSAGAEYEHGFALGCCQTI